MKKLLLLLLAFSVTVFGQAIKTKTAAQIEAKMRQKAKEEAERTKKLGFGARSWHQSPRSFEQQEPTWGWRQPIKYFLVPWAIEQGWEYNDQDELTYRGQKLDYYEKNEPEVYHKTILKQLAHIAEEDKVLRTAGQPLHTGKYMKEPTYKLEKPSGQN